MANIVISVNMPVCDPVTERLSVLLDEKRKRKRGALAETINRYMIGAQGLQELGNGILPAWVEMVESGQLDEATQSERAHALGRLLLSVTGEIPQAKTPPATTEPGRPQRLRSPAA